MYDLRFMSLLALFRCYPFGGLLVLNLFLLIHLVYVMSVFNTVQEY